MKPHNLGATTRNELIMGTFYGLIFAFSSFYFDKLLQRSVNSRLLISKIQKKPIALSL